MFIIVIIVDKFDFVHLHVKVYLCIYPILNLHEFL